ncbi:MAG TPA: hypothetical protein EYP85_10780 [Armatimonadetes bacterium]|nr:hypothetical protein [Armatimonadota bacterium]
MPQVKATQTVDPYQLNPEEVPEELLLSHYLAETEKFRHAGVFKGPLAWDTLDNIGPYLESLEPSVDAELRRAMAEPRNVCECGGNIVGNVLIEEGADIEPFVIIRATEGGVYVGKNVKIRAFTRIEAVGGVWYLEEGVVLEAGCDLWGYGLIGAGSVLTDSVLRGKIHLGEENHLLKAYLLGPTVVGNHCELRPGAFLRENSLFGDHIEFRSESKNSVVMDGFSDKATAAAHYAYIGDSILGRGVNFGAGTKTSNLKVDRSPVNVIVNGVKYVTGRKKFGAVVGDEVETGCLTVFDPGALVGPRTLTYPGTALRGYYPPNSIIKLRQTHEIVERR